MNVRYNKRDLSEHGIQIITPVDPSFESKALGYFKNQAPQELKPFSVFIENLGNKTIVAYVLTWKLSNQNGQITQSTIGYTEPGILMGDEIPKGPGFKHTTAIEPHSVRCFNWNTQIMEDDPSLSASRQTRNDSPLRQRLASKLAKATDITVTLDGAAFDDGTFVGTNIAFFQQLQAMVNAKVDLLREVAEANEQGRIEQVLSSIAR